jgi:hypothetical protein
MDEEVTYHLTERGCAKLVEEIRSATSMGGGCPGWYLLYPVAGSGVEDEATNSPRCTYLLGLDPAAGGDEEDHREQEAATSPCCAFSPSFYRAPMLRRRGKER